MYSFSVEYWEREDTIREGFENMGESQSVVLLRNYIQVKNAECTNITLIPNLHVILNQNLFIPSCNELIQLDLG